LVWRGMIQDGIIQPVSEKIGCLMQIPHHI
jgi:hypothetical protein